MSWHIGGPHTLLPQEALRQLHCVVESYQRERTNGVKTEPGSDAQIDAIAKALDQNPETLWWTDVAQAEFCTVTLLAEEEIRAQLRDWRRRMHEVIGDDRYNQYLQGACDVAAISTSVETLRSDLLECIRSTYYFYEAYGVAARSRTEVTIATIQVALSILGIEAVLALLLTWHRQPGLSVFGISNAVLSILEFLIASSAAATVGSVVSVQRRLQDPNVDVDPFYRYIQTKADRFSVAFISPLFGAVFGFVLYGLLSSNIISSSVVQFTDSAPKGNSIAALLVFGFIAGFAEQLVPDALTRVAASTLGGLTRNATPSAAKLPTTTTPSPAAGGAAPAVN